MMGEVAHSTRQQPGHNVEIVVPVDVALPQVKRAGLACALQDIDGSISAEFCPLRYHLLLVRYDRETFHSLEVPGKVNDQHVHAGLSGPL
jgi:hypothetical protein